MTALAAGLLTAGAIPAWAGTAQAAGITQVTAMHGMELQAGLWVAMRSRGRAGPLRTSPVITT